MLRFKPFLKVKPVLEHFAILNILTYLGIEPASRFMPEIVTMTEFMISFILPTLETITNCRNCIIDVIQNYSYQDRD